jgi:hypothetical protein
MTKRSDATFASELVARNLPATGPAAPKPIKPRTPMSTGAAKMAPATAPTPMIAACCCCAKCNRTLSTNLLNGLCEASANVAPWITHHSLENTIEMTKVGDVEKLDDREVDV